MRGEEGTMEGQDETFGEAVERIFRERDERRAAFRKKLAEEPPETDPGFQELIDTRDEFRERLMGHIEKMVGPRRRF
jgi:hypothetical protein